MKSQICKLEFITPAFLSGADQGQAELRAASIRGALRWWFRVLGGTKEEETEVFGGVQGGATRSKVIVRALVTNSVHGAFEAPRPMSDLGYLYYFATVSGETMGIRVRQEAYFAPGTAFEIKIVDHGIPENLRERFSQAVTCFLRIGSLGLRATRGCGAFAEKILLPRSDFEAWAKRFPAGFGKIKLISEDVFSSAKRAQECLGGCLRNLRRDNHLSGREQTALGCTNRQSSALKLRPVKVKEGFLAVVFYSDMACTASSIERLI